MRPNTYRSSHYQNTRQQSRGADKPKSQGEKIIEQFLTQLTLSALIIGMILTAQLLGIKNMDSQMAKVKEAITYSPSLKEMAQVTKDKTSLIVQRVNPKDQNSVDFKIPEIIIEEIK